MSVTTTLNVRKVTLGHIQQEEVVAADMPRHAFLDLVEDRASRMGYSAEMLPVLLPTAEKLDRFPIETWISPTRGCGCIVGEILVAQEIFDRGDFAERWGAYLDDGGPTVDIRAELAKQHGEWMAERLYTFGNMIDGDVQYWVEEHIEPVSTDRLWIEHGILSRVVLITDPVSA